MVDFNSSQSHNIVHFHERNFQIHMLHMKKYIYFTGEGNKCYINVLYNYTIFTSIPLSSLSKKQIKLKGLRKILNICQTFSFFTKITF